MLDNGADLEHRDSSTRTPLMAALLGNRTEAAALLLARGADTAVKTSPGGFTPLHLAVQQCSLDAVNLLVGQKRGVDLEAKLVDGSSPLYLAAFKGFHRVADRLVEAGADTDTENNRYRLQYYRL